MKMDRVNNRGRRALGHAAIRTDSYLDGQVLPYLGNKRKLLPMIREAITRTGVTGGTFIDSFSGTTIVGRLAKTLGFRVIANDWEPYAQELARCFIACNAPPAFDRLGGMARVFAHLDGLPPREDWVALHLCPADDDAADPSRDRMFFTRANGMRIDAVREEIAGWERRGLLTPAERACILGPLIPAVSYVSNTNAIFKAYHHGWGGSKGTALERIRGRLPITPPVLFDNGLGNEAHGLDAQKLAEELRSRRVRAQIAYLDMPYNQHAYASNYHVLNSLVLWDKPPLPRQRSPGNKAAIRADWTQRRSPYNGKGALAAYQRLLESLDADFILTSYSTDGKIPLLGLLEAAAERGALSAVQKLYPRYLHSATRPSEKPYTTEFVLIVDTSAPCRPGTVSAIEEELTRDK